MPDPTAEPQRVPSMTVAAKLAAVQQAVNAVDKTGFHPQQKFAYIEEHKVIELLRPHLDRVGAAVVVSCADRVRVDTGVPFGNKGTPSQLVTLTGSVRFICIETGDEIEASYVGEGIDTQDKAAGKAQTYLTKYALQKFFLIPTQQIEDSDHGTEDSAPAPAQAQGSAPAPAAAGSATVDEKEAQVLVQGVAGYVTDGKLDPNKVKGKLATYRTDDVASLTPEQFAAFRDWLNAEVAKAEAG